MKKAIVLATILGLLLSAIAGCSRTPASQPSQPAQSSQAAQPAEKVLKVGFIGAFSGTNAVLGKWENDGWQQAIDEINAAGGIKGYKIQNIKYDDEADPSKAVNVAKRAITEDKIIAAFATTNSNPTLAVVPIFMEYKIPHFTVASNYQITEKGSKYVIRTQCADVDWAKATVNYFVKVGKHKKWALIGDTTAVGKGIGEAVTKNLADNNLQLVTTQSYNPEDKDFSGQLTEIIRRQPDMVFLAGSEVATGLITKQLRVMGYKGDICGYIAQMTAKYVEVAGAAAEGVIGSTAWAGPYDDFSKKYADNHMKKYGYEVDAHCPGGYDAMLLLAEAIKNCPEPITGEKLADELHKIKSLKGTQGVLSVSEKGDALPNPMMAIIKDGKIVPLETK